MDVEGRILVAWRAWTTRRAHDAVPTRERTADEPRPPALGRRVADGEAADATAHIALTIDDR